MSAILEGTNSTIQAQLGFKGETGDSAYEIAVKHGYTGTEAQWADDFLNAENYYDKSEMNTLLGAKANSSDVYAKSQVYTKTETDALIVDSYSTSEVQTNKTWTDGSPIYRRVFTGSISNQQQPVASISGANVINVFGKINIGNEDANWHIIGGYINANNYSGFLMDGSVVNLWTPSGYSGSTYEITIEYIKPSS